MVSSDDEGEKVNSVSEYDFVDDRSEPVSFAELPVDWNKSGTDSLQSLDWGHQIYVQGKTDNGLRKIYKQVIAWTFDTRLDEPEISVLSNDGNWIKLIRPRRAFMSIIRTILITVHFIHYVKWNPQQSRKAMWDQFTELYSMLERRPSEDDLVDHMSLINEAVKRDETLAKSELLSSILQEKLTRRKSFNEDVKSSFFVEDDENEDGDEIEEIEDDGSDEEDDCFDYVCAICDNGGDLTVCEGKCMRSFHATVADGEESNCASLGFTDSEELKNVAFYCKNCEHKQHQCFACGELGSSDESSNPQVFRCGNGTCGHFYHPDCVAKVLHPGNEAAAKEQRERIVSGEQFACPVHRCCVCKGLEVRSEEQLQFGICRRCPRAYHRKCLPRTITSEEDAENSKNILQRAWEGLIPNRILIYCLNHKIDRRILTPSRNHIKFPGIQQTEKKKQLREYKRNKPLLKQTVSRSDDISGEKKVAKPAGRSKYNVGSKQENISRKRKKSPAQGSTKKQKLSSNRSPNSQLLESTSFAEPVKSSWGIHSMFKAEKVVDDSLTVDADTKTRILSLMKDVSSSITLDQIKRKRKVLSTYALSSKLSSENITLGKVEVSVQAINGALQILGAGGSIEDAKAVCGDFLLTKITKWKEKMRVYLAPFLYGMRYTSFGRHFTKIDKLKMIIDMLHWYIQDGDTLVDFSCGSNDFSCLAKTKIDEIGKTCLFKNYDIHQAKNDFNFERRDWMTVKPNDLPDGSRLIIGLNPPFGVNACLANKFVDKALEFKPKLLILIVPREMQRLDDKKCPYDLIWEDDQMFSGKSFYLPGSIDANNNQIEDWNLSPPVLRLWSHPNWTSRHKDIAARQGHYTGASKTVNREELSTETLVSDSEQHLNHNKLLVKKGEHRRQSPAKKSRDKQQSVVNRDEGRRQSPAKKNGDKQQSIANRDEGRRQSPSKKTGDKQQSIVNKVEDRRQSPVDKGEDDKPSKSYRHEKKDKRITSHHVVQPVDENRPGKEGHIEVYKRKPDAKRKEKQRSESRSRKDYAVIKRSVSRNPSPNMVDSRSSNHFVDRVYDRRADLQQSPTFSSYSQGAYNRNGDDFVAGNPSTFQTKYNGNEDDDLVRKYLTGPESRIAYHSSSSLEYDRRASMEQWLGYPTRMTDNSLVNRADLASSYRQLNPPVSSAAYTSAMNRYASRLDELSPARMDNMAAPRQSPSDTDRFYRGSVRRHGFYAFHPSHHYP